MAERGGIPGLVRRIGFHIGFILGLAATLLWVAVASLLANSGGAGATPAASEYATVVRSSGAALTTQGAAELVLKDYAETLTQTCRGGCDDLEVGSSNAPYGYQVQVLDARGKCIACEAGASTLLKDGTTRSTMFGGGITQTSHE